MKTHQAIYDTIDLASEGFFGEDNQIQEAFRRTVEQAPFTPKSMRYTLRGEDLTIVVYEFSIPPRV